MSAYIALALYALQQMELPCSPPAVASPPPPLAPPAPASVVLFDRTASELLAATWSSTELCNEVAGFWSALTGEEQAAKLLPFAQCAVRSGDSRTFGEPLHVALLSACEMHSYLPCMQDWAQFIDQSGALPQAVAAICEFLFRVSAVSGAVSLQQGERCCVLLHVLEQLSASISTTSNDVLRVCSILSAEPRPEPTRRLLKSYSLRIMRQMAAK